MFNELGNVNTEESVYQKFSAKVITAKKSRLTQKYVVGALLKTKHVEIDFLVSDPSINGKATLLISLKTPSIPYHTIK